MLVILSLALIISLSLNLSKDDGNHVGMSLKANILIMYGSGTPTSPYQISNIFQLQHINLDLRADYILLNDIDASESVDWNDGEGFLPIGDSSNRFCGILDGQMYNVTHLFINRPSDHYIGLFGALTDKATLKNINLQGSEVYGNYSVGGLVGDNEGGRISNCSFNGIVNGELLIGGIVGSQSQGSVANCLSNGHVTGNWSVGGLLGDNYEGSILDSYSQCSVSGNTSIGGFIGRNNYGSVANCYSTGRVFGYGDNIGGLIGNNDNLFNENLDTELNNCFSTGNVTGINRVGGLVGFNELRNSLSNCFATGDVRGNFQVGGLVGFVYFSVLSNCYAAGAVFGEESIGGLVGDNRVGTVLNCYSIGLVKGNCQFGGLIGNNTGTISSSFWDTQTSNLSTSNGGTGKKTFEMKNKNIYTSAGWDFIDIWYINEEINYPRLRYYNEDNDNNRNGTEVSYEFIHYIFIIFIIIMFVVVFSALLFYLRRDK